MVELVIVIAVIAILAAVLIPTFGGVIKKANESSALQAVQGAYKQASSEIYADGVLDFDEADGYSYGGYTFTYKNGRLFSVVENADAPEYTYEVDNISGTITKATKVKKTHPPRLAEGGFFMKNERNT